MNENIQSVAMSLVPVISVALWIYMLVDWYRFAKNRRLFWLLIILFFGIIGYLFFLFSRDRMDHDPPQATT